MPKMQISVQEKYLFYWLEYNIRKGICVQGGGICGHAGAAN